MTLSADTSIEVAAEQASTAEAATDDVSQDGRHSRWDSRLSIDVQVGSKSRHGKERAAGCLNLQHTSTLTLWCHCVRLVRRLVIQVLCVLNTAESVAHDASSVPYRRETTKTV